VKLTRGVMLTYGTGLVSGYYSACCGGVAASASDVITDHPIHDIPPLMGREGEDVCRDAPVYRWTISRPIAEVVARARAYAAATGQAALADVARIESIEPVRWNAHQRPTHYVMHINGGEHVELRADELRRALDHSEDAAGLPPPAKRLFSSFIEAKLDGETLTVNGRGHGHGAGMCQYGAQALADSGKAFEEILQWYYPTVELVPAYT
jgi:stage II sporulation protein D